MKIVIHDEDVSSAVVEKKIKIFLKIIRRKNRSAGMPWRNLISQRLVKHINMNRSASA